MHQVGSLASKCVTGIHDNRKFCVQLDRHCRPAIGVVRGIRRRDGQRAISTGKSACRGLERLLVQLSHGAIYTHNPGQLPFTSLRARSLDVGSELSSRELPCHLREPRFRIEQPSRSVSSQMLTSSSLPSAIMKGLPQLV